MKKIFALVVMVLFLSGCDAETKDYTDSYLLPKGMEDCKVYRLIPDQSRGTSEITAIVCKNSSTTTSYRQNKTTKSVSTYSN